MGDDDFDDGLDELINRTTDKRDPPKEPPPDTPRGRMTQAERDAADDTPGWAHSMMDRLDGIERRIPNPRASSRTDDDDDGDDDEPQIVSIEEVTIEPVKAAAGAVKDAVTDTVEQAPEFVHGLFRKWGGRKG